MANTLSSEKKEVALRCLVEGASVPCHRGASSAFIEIRSSALMVRVGRLWTPRCGPPDTKDRGGRGMGHYVGKKQRHLTTADDPRVAETRCFRPREQVGPYVPARKTGSLHRDGLPPGHCPNAWPTRSSPPRMHLELRRVGGGGIRGGRGPRGDRPGAEAEELFDHSESHLRHHLAMKSALADGRRPCSMDGEVQARRYAWGSTNTAMCSHADAMWAPRRKRTTASRSERR